MLSERFSDHVLNWLPQLRLLNDQPQLVLAGPTTQTEVSAACSQFASAMQSLGSWIDDYPLEPDGVRWLMTSDIMYIIPFLSALNHFYWARVQYFRSQDGSPVALLPILSIDQVQDPVKTAISQLEVIIYEVLKQRGLP